MNEIAVQLHWVANALEDIAFAILASAIIRAFFNK